MTKPKTPFPPYFDILDVTYMYQGEELHTTAEEDDYVQLCLDNFESMYTELQSCATMLENFWKNTGSYGAKNKAEDVRGFLDSLDNYNSIQIKEN